MAADRTRAFEFDEGPDASRPAAELESPAAAEAAPLSASGAAIRSIAGSPPPPGRGARPVRAAAVQRMQQTHGNRHTQRFLQRAAGTRRTRRR